MEQPMVLFVIGKTFLKHFLQDDISRFRVFRPPHTVSLPVFKDHEVVPNMPERMLCLWVIAVVIVVSIKGFSPPSSVSIRTWW